MKVLVTGGAGYVGSHVCKALNAAGYTPVVFDSFVRGHRWAVRWGPLVEGGLADRALLLKTLVDQQISAVMHFAAFAYVGESMQAPLMYFDNNVANSLSLLSAMREAQVNRLVFSSTCATYGVPDRSPIAETHPQRPINPYGVSKLFIEQVLQWQEQVDGLRWTALRYFNAAGADPDLEIGEAHEPETHIVPLAIQTALGQRPHLEIFGTDYPTKDGTAVRDFVHVTDLAEGHVKALERLDDGPCQAFNLGTGTGCSIREVVAAVEQISGRRLSVVEGPRRTGDPPILIADPTLARDQLAWQPKLSDLESIVRTAWQWHSKANTNAANKEDVRSPHNR